MTLMNINLGAWFGTSVQFLLALVAADILSGLAKAIRTKLFNWLEVADFYRSMVVPYLLGYVALAVVVKSALPDVNLFGLPFNDTVLTVAWGAIVLSVGKSVIANLKEVFNPTDIFNDFEPNEE